MTRMQPDGYPALVQRWEHASACTYAVELLGGRWCRIDMRAVENELPNFKHWNDEIITMAIDQIVTRHFRELWAGHKP